MDCVGSREDCLLNLRLQRIKGERKESRDGEDNLFLSIMVGHRRKRRRNQKPSGGKSRMIGCSVPEWRRGMHLKIADRRIYSQ